MIKILVVLNFIAIAIIVFLVVRGFKDEKDIMTLEERLDEETLEKVLARQKNVYYEERLKEIQDVCDDKKIKGVRVAQDKIKELATRPIIPSSNN